MKAGAMKQPAGLGSVVGAGVQTRNGEGIDSMYEGEVKSAGLKHGQGLELNPSGATYRGQWANDKKHGTGVYTWSDGHKFDGEWTNGNKQSHGIAVCMDESKYERGPVCA